jgi:hypothetical protein
MDLKMSSGRGEDAPAKSLILLARKKSEDGEDAIAKSLKTWRGRARTKIPHTPYALALASRSRRACRSRQEKPGATAAAVGVGGGAP